MEIIANCSHLSFSNTCPFVIYTGIVWVLENLESPEILLWNFPGLASPRKGLLVLESPENLLNSSEKI